MDNGKNGSTAENVARLTSQEARAMADYAAGLRGEGARFVVGTPVLGGALKMKDVPEHNPCSTSSEVVIPVETQFQQPARPEVVDVHIKAEGGDEKSLLGFDAVFWSESSVEKFLFPYLASKYQWLAPHMMKVLAEKWYGFVPTPSDGEAPPDVLPAAELQIPFAVGHLPRSEYITIGGEVILLCMGEHGKVTGYPLSNFLGAPPATL